MRVLVGGCGWLGTAVAAALAARGDRVIAVRRDPGRAAALRSPGVEPLVLDLADPASAARLPSADAMLACQSAREEGEAPYRRAYLDANRTLLAAAERMRPRAFVYTGSTGVFGQRDGSEVEEETAPAPASPVAEVLLEAERLLLGAAARGLPIRILRLSGLYGPGRLWMVEAVRSGRMAAGPGDGGWVNALHRDDAVEAVLAALDRGRDAAVYHATDAVPMRRREVVALVAGLLGIEVPRWSAGAAPPPGPDRRILGGRTRAELGLSLRWPSLREGLPPLLAGGAGGS